MSTPWFFLSYSSADEDEKGCVGAFYKDLVNQVRRKAGLGKAADCKVGFLDFECLQLGTLWWPDIAKAAQNARVLVCLFSPNYFASEYCLRELEIFASRLSAYQNPDDPEKRPHRVLPVLWEKPSTLVLPGGVSRIQYVQRSLGGEYAREGLLFLKEREKKKDEYTEFLDSFADMLIGEARAGVLPPAADDSPLLREPGGAPAGSPDGGPRELGPHFTRAVELLLTYEDAPAERPEPPAPEPQPKPPAGPDGLKASAASPSHVGLMWRDNSGGRAGFKVARRPGGGSPDFEEVGRKEPGTVFFEDEGCKPWTFYTYRVCAFDDAGDSGYSEDSVITPPRNPIFSGFVKGFAPKSLNPSGQEGAARPRLRLNYTRVGLALACLAFILLMPTGINRLVNLVYTPPPTPTPGPPPKLETEPLDERFNRKQQEGDEWVWIDRGEWDYPSNEWKSVDGVDGSPDLGDITVHGTTPGVNRDKLFGNFEAAFTIDYEDDGTQAGWVLRAGEAQGGERPGYYFVLKRPAQPGGNFLLSARAVSSPDSKMSPSDCSLDINYAGAKDYIEVNVTATGNSFEYKFTGRSRDLGAARASRTVGCTIKDASPNYFKWGRVGFFAGDARTTFRVEDIYVDPKPLQK